MRNAVAGVAFAPVRQQPAVPARAGQANAELLDLVSRLLGVGPRALGLSQGWSHKSKVLLVRSPRDAPLDAAQVYAKLKDAVMPAAAAGAGGAAGGAA